MNDDGRDMSFLAGGNRREVESPRLYLGEVAKTGDALHVAPPLVGEDHVRDAEEEGAEEDKDECQVGQQHEYLHHHGLGVPLVISGGGEESGGGGGGGGFGGGGEDAHEVEGEDAEGEDLDCIAEAIVEWFEPHRHNRVCHQHEEQYG